MSDQSRHKNILKLLMDHQREQIRVQWPEGSGQFLPPGEIPMPLFQGAEVGGSAANVRLSELRMPEELKKNYRGIPIHKNVHAQLYDGKSHRVVTYRLGVKPGYVDKFIDFDNCRLRKDVIAGYGGQIVEFDDDADGKDKSGKTVKIIAKSSASPPVHGGTKGGLTSGVAQSSAGFLRQQQPARTGELNL